MIKGFHLPDSLATKTITKQKRWNPNPGVLRRKSLVGSKVDSAFHSS